MNLGPHAAFIVAAYAATTAVLVALVVWIFVDHRMQARALADLEAKGVTRRAAARAREAT